MRPTAAACALSHAQLRYYEHLHAKCYVGEQALVLTSMNLYAASERNREMGVLLEAKQDKAAFAEARQETYAIRDLAEPETLSEVGFCVRCRAEIERNPAAPYCYRCWQTWARFGNPYYVERACHACGSDYETTMHRPLCKPCYYSPQAPQQGPEKVRLAVEPRRSWSRTLLDLARGWL